MSVGRASCNFIIIKRNINDHCFLLKFDRNWFKQIWILYRSVLKIKLKQENWNKVQESGYRITSFWILIETASIIWQDQTPSRQEHFAHPSELNDPTQRLFHKNEGRPTMCLYFQSDWRKVPVDWWLPSM